VIEDMATDEEVEEAMASLTEEAEQSKSRVQDIIQELKDKHA